MYYFQNIALFFRRIAVVADEDFFATVIEIDLITGRKIGAIMASEQEISDIELTQDGALWIADRNCFDPGIRVFQLGAVQSASEVTTKPIYPGLSPFTILLR
jgi:hypothetical protein